MKKFISAIMLAFSVLNASAQLTVYNNGNVNVGSTLQSSNVTLSVGDVAYSDTAYHVSLSLRNPATGGYNIGGEGIAYSSTTKSSGRSFGLRGVAGNCTSGYNFGVLGALQGKQGGAAVFGTTNGKTLGMNVGGCYAGYFDGNVKVTGLLSGDVVNQADVPSVTNAKALSLTGVLDGIVATTPYKYMVDKTLPLPTPGGVSDSSSVVGPTFPTTPTSSTSIVIPSTKKTQYALTVGDVKAQFPDLIIKDSNGTEYVNYTQLVPLLVQAIKELKEEVDELKEAAASSQSRKAPTNINTTSIDSAQGSVSQNTPNPFTGLSTLRVSVPDDATDAYLDILTGNGQSVKRIPVDNGQSEVSLSSYEFAPGTYLYTLVVNGKAVDTKRMIINR